MAIDNEPSSLERRQRLRQQQRKLRQSLDDVTRAAHSAAIVDRTLALLEETAAGVKKMAAYLAFGGEVNVDALLERCRTRGQLTFVPVIKANHTMVFAPINDATPFTANQYGIREPEIYDQNCLPANEMDTVIVPLVAFDQRCNRMGMGGGYYDRTFAHKRQPATDSPVVKPVLIGVAYELQWADSVYADWWDVPLDFVVTEQRTIKRST